MNKKSLIVCVGILFIEILVAINAFSQNSTEIISVIPKRDMKYGCGCTYVLKPVDTQNYQFIFYSDLGFDNPKMRIYDKMVSLEPISVKQIPSDAKIGDGFSQTFRYDNVELHFENKIIFVCPKGDEGCEVITFDSILTIKEGNNRNEYQVLGDCGC